MLDAEIAHTTDLDLAVLDRIFHCAPAFQSLGFSTVWAVEKEEVNVVQTTVRDRLLDCLASGIVGRIGRKLRCEMNVLSLERGGIARAGQELADRGADFALVVIHLRRVDAVGRQDMAFCLLVWIGNAHARYPA